VTVVAGTCAGKSVELHGFDGKNLHLVSAVAFAPGQRIAPSFALDAPLSLQLKSLGSVRRPDGRFDVRARAVTLRKEERALLLSAFPPDAG
jgi:hypothetical protein